MSFFFSDRGIKPYSFQTTILKKILTKYIQKYFEYKKKIQKTYTNSTRGFPYTYT